MRVAFFSSKDYDKYYFNEANERYHQELTFLEPSLNDQTKSLAYDYPAICVFVNDHLDRNVIENLADHGLRLIALRCAGFNNVDLEAAVNRNVKIVRVPAYSPHAVAEHAVALILTLNRKTHKAYNRVREQNFSLERLTGFDLYQRTVGVIGTGKIGSVFCKIMQGFGCKVIAYDKFPSEELQEEGIDYVSLDELLSVSDIISLHCPLTPETYHIINASSIEKMKDGVMLINTSRGSLVDTQATVEALQESKIGYLGIDVYEQEDALFFKDLSEMVIRDELIMRLTGYPNVLVTAHQAFFTENALRQIANTTLKNIVEFETQDSLTHEVTLDMMIA